MSGVEDMRDDEPLDLRRYLSGDWRIERIIEDRRACGDARFEGTGTFSPEGDGLLYRETGRLMLGETAHEAAQSHRWSFPGIGRAEVGFADGRPFHAFAPVEGEARADHHCAPDDYHVRYRFDAANAWRQEWTVRGPAKDYTSRSRFTRLHRAAHPVQSSREQDP